MPSIHYSSFEAGACRGVRTIEARPRPLEASSTRLGTSRRREGRPRRARSRRATRSLSKASTSCPGLLEPVDGAVFCQVLLAIEDEDGARSALLDARLGGPAPLRQVPERARRHQAVQDYLVGAGGQGRRAGHRQHERGDDGRPGRRPRPRRGRARARPVVSVARLQLAPVGKPCFPNGPFFRAGEPSGPPMPLPPLIGRGWPMSTQSHPLPVRGLRGRHGGSRARGRPLARAGRRRGGRAGGDERDARARSRSSTSRGASSSEARSSDDPLAIGRLSGAAARPSTSRSTRWRARAVVARGDYGAMSMIAVGEVRAASRACRRCTCARWPSAR